MAQLRFMAAFVREGSWVDARIDTALPPMMGAEDFSYMAQAAPGCFVRLGVHDPAWGDDHYNVHRADFQMDENALPIGAAMLAAVAIQWMERNGR